MQLYLGDIATARPSGTQADVIKLKIKRLCRIRLIIFLKVYILACGSVSIWLTEKACTLGGLFKGRPENHRGGTQSKSGEINCIMKTAD